MGFDVQAFATGFLESRVKDIEKKGDEARAFEEQQRTQADRNTQTLSKRNAVVQQVVGLSNMLRDNGASERVIQAAIAAGPQEITTLANKVTEARKAAGGGKLGASDIEALVNIPEGFSVMDTDTTDLIRKTYGLGYEGKGVTKDMPERSFMDRLRGDKQMDMARARLDREVIKDGYTAYDVNQMSAQQDYESLVPGTFITFNDIKVFRPSEDMDGFTRTINALTKAVEDTNAYSTLKEDIETYKAQSSINETDEGIREDGKVKLAKARAEMDELYLSTVGTTIQDMVDTYGESFIDGAGGYLKSFLSDSYVDSLALGTTETAEPEEDDLEAAFPDATTSTPRTTDPADATSTGFTTPEVEVSLLPDANMDELSAARPKVRPQPEGEPEVTSEVTPEVATPSEQETNPLEITQYIPPNALANAADSALGLSAAAETAQLNIDNQKTMAQAMATVTREEWDEMSRAERKEKGLPVRRLDIAYAGKDNFKKIEKERVKSIRERAAEKFGNIDPAKFDDALDSGMLTELDLQIFVDHGDDIIDFIKDNLYSIEPEGIIEAMSDWAEENEKTLPMDKSFLVKTFGTALEE